MKGGGFMIKKIDTFGKVWRIVLALAIFGLGYYYESWWGLLGLIPLAFGASGYCYIPPFMEKKDCKDDVPEEFKEAMEQKQSEDTSEASETSDTTSQEESSEEESKESSEEQEPGTEEEKKSE